MQHAEANRHVRWFVTAGNIAAEDFEFRQTLIANGVVRPLAQLVVGARKALDAGGEWPGSMCAGLSPTGPLASMGWVVVGVGLVVG